MKRQTPTWQKAIFLASLGPPIFCGVIWPLSHYSELQTIAVRLPKSGFVVQHGVMVWIFGDYEYYLRSMNRAVRSQPSLGEVFLGKKIIPRKQRTYDDTPPPMQIAGYALMATRYDTPTINLGFVKYFNAPIASGGGGHFLRFDMGQTVLVAAVVPLVLWLVWRARNAAALRREARGYCSVCGYDIRAVSQARCPECGTEFSRAAEELSPRAAATDTSANSPPAP
ncbi:MAG: hypothetical protein DCC65_13815 [Planctomycetota bacterium]|nr:MAG: hypothetical protein DCC65_13815 [Planctomycetota bacterium]